MLACLLETFVGSDFYDGALSSLYTFEWPQLLRGKQINAGASRFHGNRRFALFYLFYNPIRLLDVSPFCYINSPFCYTRYITPEPLFFPQVVAGVPGGLAGGPRAY